MDESTILGKFQESSSVTLMLTEIKMKKLLERIIFSLFIPNETRNCLLTYCTVFNTLAVIDNY